MLNPPRFISRNHKEGWEKGRAGDCLVDHRNPRGHPLFSLYFCTVLHIDMFLLIPR